MAHASDVHRDELFHSLDGLFKEGKYSDLTITCGYDKYKVHKAIICPRSLFFETACSGPFEEGKTGIVALPDDNPRVVELMIRFFYYLDYPKLPEIWQDKSPEAAQDEKQWLSAGWGPPQPEFEESIGPNLTIHAMVYALGEKYDIQGLKALSLEKFKKEARSYWDSDDFLRAVEEVYTSTIDADRGMRDAVVDAIRQHSTVLDKESMQAVVRRVEPLCFDLMMGFRPGTQMQTVKPFRRARGVF